MGGNGSDVVFSIEASLDMYVVLFFALFQVSSQMRMFERRRRSKIAGWARLKPRVMAEGKLYWRRDERRQVRFLYGNGSRGQ